MWKQFKEYLQEENVEVYEEESTGFLIYKVTNMNCLIKEVYIFPEARLRTKHFWDRFVKHIKQEHPDTKTFSANVYVPKKNLNVLRTTLKLGFKIIAAHDNWINLLKEL